MKKLFFILAVTSTIVSCKKSSPAPAGCTVSTASIAGKYTISAITYKSSSTATPTDIFASMQDCIKDDSYELKADGSLVIAEEASNCGLPPSPGIPESWSLSDNNKTLVLGAYLEIVSFDCNKLVVNETNILVNGDIKTTTYLKK